MRISSLSFAWLPRQSTLTLVLGLLLALPLWSRAAVAESLQSLDDASLGEVAAQQGIAFDLEYRINTKADGEPVDAAECPTVGVLTGGSSCRIAYSLADSSGMWIVLKNYRGMIKLTNIHVDAESLAADWTPRTSGSQSGTGGQAAYMNPYLCINPAGCTSASPVSAYYDPRNKPALQLSAGNWATALAAGTSSYNTYLNRPYYTDFTTSLFVERMTAEFDTSSSQKDGYLKNNVAGAPIALRIAHGVGLVPDPNNPPDVMVGPYGNAPAQVRLDGKLQIYGFGF
jgi:hypothetical protein